MGKNTAHIVLAAGVAFVVSLLVLTISDNIAKGLTAAPEERNQSMEAYTNGQVLLPSGD